MRADTRDNRTMRNLTRTRLGTQTGLGKYLATGPAAWYDTRDLTLTTQQTLTNRVGVTTLQLGSDAGADTNDPAALPSSGYVFTSGVNGNYLSVPDEAALDITGDIDVRADIALPTYTPSTRQTVVSKTHSTGNQRSWTLEVTTTGLISLLYSADGVSYSTTSSTVSLTTVVASAGRTWIRATLDVDNGAGGRDINFYTSTDGTSWTQLGATVTVGSTISLFSSTANVNIGAASAGTSLPCLGSIYRAVIKDGINGTTVLDVNPATETITQTTWTATTGQTVTVNRSTSGLTTVVVTRPTFNLDGSDNYLQAPAGNIPTFTASTGAYTVMLINRVHNLAGAATLSRVWSSESASNNGAHIYLDQTSAQYKVLVGGATTTATTAAATFTQTTQLHAVAAVFDNGTAYAYSTTTGLTAGTDYTGVGTITHANPRIGSRADSVANPADLEVAATVHWTRALNATELTAAANYLLGTYT